MRRCVGIVAAILSSRVVAEENSPQKTTPVSAGSSKLPHFTQKDEVVRIINGEAASEEEYPFAEVSVRYPNGQHMCGGSLVAPDMVLTAGHCMAETVGAIQIGRYNFANPSDTYESFTVADKETHPLFDRQALRYDFALAKLSGAVQTNYSLIRLNNDTSFPQAGDEVIVIGWGATSTQTWDFPNVLQQTTVQVITNDACQSFQMYGQRLYEGEIFNEMICAYSLGTDACSGDSGGPLVTGLTDGATQVGVVSWGRGCALYPGVYGRVSSGYDWIRSSICSNSSNPPEYLECGRGGQVHSGGSSSTVVDDDDSDLWGETQQPTSSPLSISSNTPTVETSPTLPTNIEVNSSPTASPSPPAVNISNVDVVVEIQLDNNSGETSWYLAYSNGTMISKAKNGTYAGSAGMRITRSITLESPGSYKFTIMDSGGDGLCCLTDGTYQTVGFYRIYIPSEGTTQAGTLVYGAGNFGAKETRYFSLPSTVDATKSNGEEPASVASATASANTQSPTTSSSYSTRGRRHLLPFGIATVLLTLVQVR